MRSVYDSSRRRFCRHRLLHYSLRILFINQRKSKSALSLNKRLRFLRLHHQRSKKTRLLRLRSIVADHVSTSGSFEEAVAGFQYSHGLVVHLVEHGASKNLHGCGSAVVGVWWRAGAGWEGDFETDDAFVGGVGELVLVHELKCREWGA